MDKHTLLFGGRERFGNKDESGGCLSLLLQFGSKRYEGEVEGKASEKRGESWRLRYLRRCVPSLGRVSKKHKYGCIQMNKTA